MPSPVNVAIPLEATAEGVPTNTPPEPVVIVAVMVAEDVVTVKLLASWTATVCVTPKADPEVPTAVLLLESLVAAPDERVMDCVATVSPLAVKVIVNVPAVPTIPKLVNVATPLAALTVTVPIKVPPEPAVKEAVTDEPVATVLLAESWKVRTG